MTPDGGPLAAVSATEDAGATIPAASVAATITSANKLIADAHEHGRKRVTFRDTLIARFHFFVARRLARFAWRCAVAGKRRLS